MVSRLNAPVLIGCTVPVILITKHFNEAWYDGTSLNDRYITKSSATLGMNLDNLLSIHMAIYYS